MCICLCQNTGAMNRPLRLAECFVVILWVFVALLTIRLHRIGRLLAAVGADSSCPCIRVRHVFVICVLHIRHAKVWFLHQKSMVFGVQKGGFYIAKVWFLFFECWVVAICLECYHNPSAAFWQSVRSRRGPIYRARIYIFATHFVCVSLILKACYGSFAL